MAAPTMPDRGPELDLARRIRAGRRPGQDDVRRLHGAVLSCELDIIGLQKHAFDRSAGGLHLRDRFCELCGECLDLMQALPEPQDDELRSHDLRLFSYAYLGERREAPEIAGRLLGARSASAQSWPDRVFESAFSAVLMLGRAEPGDPERASDEIAILRREQPAEEPYLDGVAAEYKRGAACELASLYMLAGCVETAAQSVKRGSPGDAHAILDERFDSAISYCQAARLVELELAERMLHLVLKKMAEDGAGA